MPLHKRPYLSVRVEGEDQPAQEEGPQRKKQRARRVALRGKKKTEAELVDAKVCTGQMDRHSFFFHIQAEALQLKGATTAQDRVIDKLLHERDEALVDALAARFQGPPGPENGFPSSPATVEHKEEEHGPENLPHDIGEWNEPLPSTVPPLAEQKRKSGQVMSDPDQTKIKPSDGKKKKITCDKKVRDFPLSHHAHDHPSPPPGTEACHLGDFRV